MPGFWSIAICVILNLALCIVFTVKYVLVYCRMSFPHDFGTQTNHGNSWPAGIWFSWWISMDFQWNPRRKLSCLPSINQTWQWQVVFLHEHKHVQTCLMFSIAMLFFLKYTHFQRFHPTFQRSSVHQNGRIASRWRWSSSSPDTSHRARILRVARRW